MEILTTMDAQQKALTSFQVDAFNKKLSEGREVSNVLDKDDFLKILITQLTHQDPTEPMKDKEFIAQMAQFSSLEQMTNMAGEFGKLARSLESGQAMGLLGRQVEIIRGDEVIAGTVEAVKGKEFPQLLVNGTYYGFDEVERVSM
ncbi:MAG: flagellar hook assembly protein FlgD [Spirochaetales bacterium]|nr:flagellar hook assembly protein FlgD [Spirochaetales bacterium]